jgi:flavodoxin
MKTLVVYYSYEGNTAVVAEAIKKALGADAIRLETIDEKRRAGLVKYVWGGRQAVTGARPSLKPCSADWGGYDLFVFGCPVWAGQPAPALMSFLDTFETLPARGKRAAVFCCSMGAPGKTLETLKARLSALALAGEQSFVMRGGTDKTAVAAQAETWAASLADAALATALADAAPRL